MNQYMETKAVITRQRSYFTNADFDCTRDHLLNEIAARAEYWFKQTDGTYNIPRLGGKIEQLIEMAIAAELKKNQINQYQN